MSIYALLIIFRYIDHRTINVFAPPCFFGSHSLKERGWGHTGRTDFPIRYLSILLYLLSFYSHE